MKLVIQYIFDAFYQTLNISEHDSKEFHGMWVSITLDEWLSYAKEKSLFDATCILTTNFKKHFSDFLIEKINNCSYGSGSYYEIYEQRRQEEIELFLSKLHLRENAAIYFKEKVEYIEDFGSFTSKCEHCEKDVSPKIIAMSLQIEGEVLCTSCLNSLYH